MVRCILTEARSSSQIPLLANARSHGYPFSSSLPLTLASNGQHTVGVETAARQKARDWRLLYWGVYLMTYTELLVVS